jgi:hypothetical protein
MEQSFLFISVGRMKFLVWPRTKHLPPNPEVGEKIGSMVVMWKNVYGIKLKGK